MAAVPAAPAVAAVAVAAVVVAMLAAAVFAVAAGCAPTPSIPAAPSVPPPPPQEPQPADIVAETVLTAPLGEGPGELGAVFPDGAESRVPGAFVVTRDAVLILDTLKARVLEYRGGRLSRVVSFPEVIEGALLAVDAQGDWYIYDAVGDVVLRASPEGEVKARWPTPDDLQQKCVPWLKQGAAGEVVLALGDAGLGEYGLAKPLAGPTAGLSFPGHTERYAVKILGPRTAAICADGQEKWQLLAPERLSGASLVGFDGHGCLIALGTDFSLDRSLLLYVLHPDGGVLRAILEVRAFEAFPGFLLTVGEDGELYSLGFTRDAGVVQRLSVNLR